MIFRKKEITATRVESIVVQIRYLIEQEKATDEYLKYKIGQILSDLGLKVEYISQPRPWKRTKDKK